jgi:hypothetical protein
MSLEPRAVPIVQAWELERYYRSLKSAILTLEEAWAEGTLGTRLEDRELLRVVGPEISAIYGQVARSRSKGPTPFRRNSIHAILEPVKELLSEPQRAFRATKIEVPPPRTESPAAEPDPDAELDAPLVTSPLKAIAVETPSGPIRLPIAQVAAVRAWGIGFEFDDPEVANAAAQTLVDLTLHRVAVDLRDLVDIERWLRRRTARASSGAATAALEELVHIVPDAGGRLFEQLILDLLNEEQLVARRAPLREDFIEKTDLRVHVPRLNRRRGARVQVTQTIFQNRLEQKLARIPRVNEFVILSPRSLAEALDREAGTELLSPADLELFWAMFPRPPIDIEEMARGLKQILAAAMAQPITDPRGPLALVPEPLRRLVRSFVATEAYRTTSELREREQRDGPRFRRKRRTT